MNTDPFQASFISDKRSFDLTKSSQAFNCSPGSYQHVSMHGDEPDNNMQLTWFAWTKSGWS